MIIEFIKLGGYGFYVWPAFIFTFVTFFIFYIKIQKEFKKVEIVYFKNFNKPNVVRIHPTFVDQKKPQNSSII